MCGPTVLTSMQSSWQTKAPIPVGLGQQTTLLSDQVATAACSQGALVVVMTDGLGMTTVSSMCWTSGNGVAAKMKAARDALPRRGRVRAALIGDRHHDGVRALAGRLRTMLFQQGVDVIAERLDGQVQMIQVDGFGQVTDMESGSFCALSALRA